MGCYRNRILDWEAGTSVSWPTLPVTNAMMAIISILEASVFSFGT